MALTAPTKNPGKDGAGEGYPSDRRLHKRFEFRHVQQHGARVHTRCFTVLLCPRQRHDTGSHADRGSVTGAEPSRLGITVTRRVAGSVGRNRIKRLVREVFRRNQEIFPDARDIVVIAKRCAVDCNLDEIRAQLLSASPSLFRQARKQGTGPR